MGDQVFLKLQPYVETSLAQHANHKLSFKFYGPFPVIEKVNDVAYKLQLPLHASFTWCSMFHSYGKALLLGMTVLTDLPSSSDDLAVPIKVLQSRWCRKNEAMVEQVKVRWSEDSSLGTTWEDREALHSRFPQAAVGGKPQLKREGMLATLP